MLAVPRGVSLWRNLLPLLLGAILAASTAHGAQRLDGRVADVKDGDTIVVEDRVGQFHTVRLSAIDSPELAQPRGREARDRLRQLLAGKAVSVDIIKLDRYGRYVGKVTFDGGTDAGLAMVRTGLAWWYQRYAREQSSADRAAYESAERDARAKRAGIWQDEHPTAPWDFRQATSTAR